MSAVPDTFFTAAPHWRWIIICYFFLGGIAGGCYMLAVLADIFGDPGDRRLARTGYCIAFAALVLSGLLLTVDLGRPLRFWHMLVQSHTGRPMFKPWSPMSVGSWALLLFGAVSFLSFLAALADAGQLPWRGLGRLRPPGTLGYIVGVVGGLLGFFVAGYTGVLLSRRVDSDTRAAGPGGARRLAGRRGADMAERLGRPPARGGHHRHRCSAGTPLAGRGGWPTHVSDRRRAGAGRRLPAARRDRAVVRGRGAGVTCHERSSRLPASSS
jgi:hypothetical protein